MEAKIEYWNINRLVPYEKNPRVNDHAIDAICASINEFGFRVPIIAKSDGLIIDGHLRYKALLKMGYSQNIPIILADDLSEAQIKALRLAANKTAELANWDISQLQCELRELQDLDFNLNIVGFNPDELTSLGIETVKIEDIDDPEPEPEPGPEPEPEPEGDGGEKKRPTVSRVGDVWLLGRHRLVCGDSQERGTFEALMHNDRAAMVFTDPPYGVAIGDKNKALNSLYGGDRTEENIESDCKSADELYEILCKSFQNLKSFCTEDASYYVTAPQGGDIWMMMMMMKDSGLEVKHMLIWLKNSATFSLGRLDYDYQHEPILYTWGKSHKFYGKGDQKTSVWRYNKPQASKLHPTMKPIELIQNALLNSSMENDIVLDAFGGSGSTLIACENLGRRARLVEVDPHYCDVIVERWQKHAGKRAVLESSNKVYGMVAKERLAQCN